MGELDAVQLGARPFHAGIRRALAEVDVVLPRKPFEVIIGEDQRAIDKAVDHQPVVFLAQLNRTGMVAFKRAALRRDRAVERMDRREVDR